MTVEYNGNSYQKPPLNDQVLEMAYYQHHVFFCVNERDNNEDCCHKLGAQVLRDYAKQRIKELGLKGQGRVRINRAGCMGRCGEGPVMVVYPEAVWYSYLDKEDIDEIIEKHLQQGQVVERLKI